MNSGNGNSGQREASEEEKNKAFDLAIFVIVESWRNGVITKKEYKTITKLGEKLYEQAKKTAEEYDKNPPPPEIITPFDDKPKIIRREIL